MILPILKLFINKFAKLSILKYSSNVVEKCLEKGGEVLKNLNLGHRSTLHRGNCVIQQNSSTDSQ